MGKGGAERLMCKGQVRPETEEESLKAFPM